MLSDFAKKQIQRMEKEYEKLEEKALKCKSEKTEAHKQASALYLVGRLSHVCRQE